MIRKKINFIYELLFKRYGPQDWWPGDTRFEIIVGAILTQNTAWTNVEKAIKNLKAAKVLTPSGLKDIPVSSLAALIRPAGYFNVKAKRLKSFVAYLYDRFGGSLDKMSRVSLKELRPELLLVHGVGPETCDSILLYAFNKPTFVVDAYTKRIFSKHKLISEDAPYHDVRALFMRGLPEDSRLYNEYHALIVKLAKDHCKSTPQCHSCPLRDV